MPTVASRGTRVWTDLDLNFIPNPVSGDVMPLAGDDSIKRSVSNLVKTAFFERPYRPWLGSGAIQHLFENDTPMTAVQLQNAIVEVIDNFEPRVELVDVVVSPGQFNTMNGYNIDIVYFIVNNTLPTEISLFLQRVR